ncbi:MAG TPA: hypothetical protein VGE07_04195, partial [Herpetosiphonaceae bacterium]
MLGLIGLAGGLLLVSGEDFWWHAKLGEWMFANGALPRLGLFSSAAPEAPQAYLPWLSAGLLAALYKLGGLGLIFLLRNLLLVGTYGLVGWYALRRSRNPRAAALGVLFAALGGISAWDVQPAMFAWPLAALTAVILGEASAERWTTRALWALPVIGLLWANLHDSFFLGPLLAGAAALGAWFDRRNDHIDAPAYPTARALWLAAGAMLLATLANPRGPLIYATLWDLWTNPQQRLFTEWLSPLFALANPFIQLFLLSVVMTLISTAVVYEKLTIRDWLMLAAALLPALLVTRYLVWFGFVAGPLLADALARRGRFKLIKSTAPPGKPIKALVAALALAALLLQPPLRFLLPLAGASDSPDGRLSAASAPIAAVDYLDQSMGQGRVFHDLSAASYLIWRSSERWPPFVDQRAQLYPLAQWAAYRCVSRGEDWEALLGDSAIGALLLDTERQPALVDLVAADPDWVERFRAQRVVVFQRVGPPPPAGPRTCA